MKTWSFTFLFALIFTACAWAAAATPNSSAQTENKTGARVRSYPGGRDEEDLRVQDVLVTPTARIDRKSLDSKVIKETNGKSDEDDDQPVEE
jgi:hypothetical protein